MPDHEQDQEQPPEWFYDQYGNRLGVNKNEIERGRWFAERGLEDPAKTSAAMLVATHY